MALRRYMPFYKWSLRGMEDLFLLQECTAHLKSLPRIFSLISDGQWEDCYNLAYQATESICAAVATQLNAQGFSTVRSDFLQDHLKSIMDGISDPQLRSLHFMADCNN